MGKLEALQELRKAWILKYGNSEQIQEIISCQISELMSTNTKLTTEVLNSIEDNLKSASRYRSPSSEKLTNLYSSKVTSASLSHLNRTSKLAESSNIKKTLREKPSISNATAESHKLKSTNKSKSAKNLIKSSSDFIRLKYPRASQPPKFPAKSNNSMSTSPMKQVPVTRDTYEYPKSVQVSSRYVSNSVENSGGKYDWGRVVRREYELYEEQAYAQRLKSIEDKQKYKEFLKKQMIELQNKQEMLKNENLKEKQRLDAQLRQIKLEEKIQQQEERKRKKYVQELMDENLRNLEISRQKKESQRFEAKEYVHSKVQEDQLAERAEAYKRKVQKKVLASEMSQMIDEKLARKLKEKEREREEEIIKQREMEIILENQAKLAQEERESRMNMQVKVDTLTKLADPRKFTKDMNSFLEYKYRKEAQELEELHRQKKESDRQKRLKAKEEIHLANSQNLDAKKKQKQQEEAQSLEQQELSKRKDIQSLQQERHEKEFQRAKLRAYKEELDSQLLDNQRYGNERNCMTSKEIELNRGYLRSIGL